MGILEPCFVAKKLPKIASTEAQKNTTTSNETPPEPPPEQGFSKVEFLLMEVTSQSQINSSGTQQMKQVAGSDISILQGSKILLLAQEMI